MRVIRSFFLPAVALTTAISLAMPAKDQLRMQDTKTNLTIVGRGRGRCGGEKEEDEEEDEEEKKKKREAFLRPVGQRGDAISGHRQLALRAGLKLH